MRKSKSIGDEEYFYSKPKFESQGENKASLVGTEEYVSPEII
jgi:hypothetical protein